jgi:hypothetical protein
MICIVVAGALITFALMTIFSLWHGLETRRALDELRRRLDDPQ